MSRPPSPRNPEEATQLLVEVLRRAIEMHDDGRAEELADDYDDVEVELLPIPPADEVTGRLALNFWDSWADAARHDWQYYPGIAEDDWPRLAATIITALEAGRSITDPVLLKHFAARPSLWRRLCVFFGIQGGRV